MVKLTNVETNNMNKDYTVWKIFGGYLLILLLMLVSSTASGQTYNCDEDICVVEFNASWNSANNVVWLHKLSDIGTKRILIDKDRWNNNGGILTQINKIEN